MSQVEVSSIGASRAELPAPLREGTVLDERFAVGAVLGHGGFGITYLAEDLARGDRAVVNELAPLGSKRVGDDVEFRTIGPAAAQRLRHQFTSDYRRLQRFRLPRVPQVRAVFHEHGTAYYATEFIEGARRLTEILDHEPMDPEQVRRIYDQLLDTLEALHNHTMLHQDVRPSNILLGRNDEPYLIDFGSARQWHADLTIAHDAQFLPEFAAMEQLSERGRRTPATDLYGLAATTYTLLAGSPPSSALARLEGSPLIPLRAVRPDVPERFALAISASLALDPGERPQSVAEVRDLLAGKGEVANETDRVRELDAKRRRLQRFRHDPMQCPACGDVLTVPEPLATDVCPVCQNGKIKRRRIEEKACPSCGGGILHVLENNAPIRFCPDCRIGHLFPQRRFLRETRHWTCVSCSFALEKSAIGAKDKDGADKTWDQWREQSGRQTHVMFCDACHGQFDVMPDGRWQRVTPDLLGHEWTRLYPDEWARVAAGLPPDAGNAHCETCSADFFVGDGCVTLLSDPPNDPYSFASHYCGHLIPTAELPYLAVGKESGHDGLVCKSCRIEFDTMGQELRLVRSSDPRLRSHAGEEHRLRDWHRIAQDLPQSGHEDEIDADLSHALAEAFHQGEIPFDARKPNLVWRGTASEIVDDSLQERPKRLVIDDEAIILGGPFKKRTELLRDVERTKADGDVIELRLIDGEIWRLRIEPLTLTFRLESGKDEVKLNAEDLARRLSAMAKRRRGKP